jgi:cbb3-type cytochrome oxidase subunit 3
MAMWIDALATIGFLGICTLFTLVVFWMFRKTDQPEE